MTSQPSEPLHSSKAERHQVEHRTGVALQAMGVPNSISSQFDFWNDRYVPAYVVAQLLGASLTTLLLWALIGKQGSAGRPGP